MRSLRRLIVLLAGMTGVLALLAAPAHAIHVVGNHCEPTRTVG